jgi:hypothetical protein
MPPPIAFISYSNDSAEHVAWVEKLAGDLRSKGIDARLDRWELRFGQDTTAFMQKQISESDRVLLICSDNYVKRADEGTAGGVPFERMIISAELVQALDTIKFVPVIRGQTDEPKSPKYVGHRMYVDLRNDANYDKNLEELARDIFGLSSKPPIGKNPYETEIEGV